MSDDDVMHAVRILQRHGLLNTEVDALEIMAIDLAGRVAAGYYSGDVDSPVSYDADRFAQFAWTVVTGIHDRAQRRLIQLAKDAEVEDE